MGTNFILSAQDKTSLSTVPVYIANYASAATSVRLNPASTQSATWNTISGQVEANSIAVIIVTSLARITDIRANADSPVAIYLMDPG